MIRPPTRTESLVRANDNLRCLDALEQCFAELIASYPHAMSEADCDALIGFVSAATCVLSANGCGALATSRHRAFRAEMARAR